MLPKPMQTTLLHPKTTPYSTQTAPTLRKPMQTTLLHPNSNELHPTPPKPRPPTPYATPTPPKPGRSKHFAT